MYVINVIIRLKKNAIVNAVGFVINTHKVSVLITHIFKAKLIIVMIVIQMLFASVINFLYTEKFVILVQKCMKSNFN